MERYRQRMCTFARMSRGFVKEDDQEEAPFIPARAPLPEGTVNLVTARGLRLLQEEREHWEAQRAGAQGSDAERRREQAAIDGRLALLNERIATARPVEASAEAPMEVRFGTRVTYSFTTGPQKGTERTFTIVGVDEANVGEQRIAFTSPIARALLGKRAGDRLPVVLGGARHELEVIAIAQAPADQ